MESIKFSIILPTFNRANFITKAIESVINQTYKNWELIVIDDGSTDNTEEIIQKFIKKEKRITYYYQKNQERSAARNNGIKRAKGDYICFLDSDDLYYPTHIEKFEKLINDNNNQQAIYVCGVSFESYDPAPQKYIEQKSNLDFVLINPIGTPRTCLSKEILKKHQFNPSICIGEDKELWVRIVNDYPIFYHDKKTFIEIDHNERSINESHHEHYFTLNFIFSNLKNKKYTKKIRKSLYSDAYFNIARQIISRNLFWSGFIYLIKSILTDINNHQTKYKINIALQLLTGNIVKAKRLLGI